MNRRNVQFWSSILGVILAMIGSFYGLSKYIDSQIKKTLTDDQFIKILSTHIRPFVIFDARKTILVDSGAMQFLDKIEIQHDSSGFALKIIIFPKIYLSNAPLLEQYRTPAIKMDKIRPQAAIAEFKNGKLSVEWEEQEETPAVKELNKWIVDMNERVKLEQKYRIYVERGQEFQWVYTIKSKFSPDDAKDWQFKLEIIR